jgi:hypothetical protein
LAQSAPEFTASVAAVSDNVFRGQRLAGVSVQPMLEWSAGPASGGLSTSVALQHRAIDVAEVETDVFAGYRWRLSPAWGIRPGATAYLYRGAPAGYRRAIFEPNLAIDFTVGAVRFTPVYYHDFSRQGSTVELNAAVALPLRSIGSELDLTLTGGSYRLDDAFSAPLARTTLRGDYWQCDATVPLQLTQHAKLTFALSYIAAANAYLQPQGSARVANPLATHRVVVRLGYSYVF